MFSIMGNLKKKLPKRMRDEEVEAAESDLREIEIFGFLFDVARFQLTSEEVQAMAVSETEFSSLLDIYRAREIDSPPILQKKTDEKALSAHHAHIPTPPLSPKHLSSLSGFSLESASKVPKAQDFKIPFNNEYPMDFLIPQGKSAKKSKSKKRKSTFNFQMKLENENGEDRGRLFYENSPIPVLKFANNKPVWLKNNIYVGLSDAATNEFDKILRESQDMKVKMLVKINSLQKTTYKYHISKSHLRANFTCPIEGFERSFNNIASRRSRLRRKFQIEMKRIILDIDQDENLLLDRQQTYMFSVIEELEKRILADENSGGIDAIMQIRHQQDFV